MKIQEPKWSPYSAKNNQEAIESPKVGDYWSEMGCPYFVVVDTKEDLVTILCAFERDEVKNARVIGDKYWHFDLTKHSVVTKDWLEQRVTYRTIPGFCADVSRDSPQILKIVSDWRNTNMEYAPIKPIPKQNSVWFLGV